jgi:hypothetical protein
VVRVPPSGNSHLFGAGFSPADLSVFFVYTTDWTGCTGYYFLIVLLFSTLLHSEDNLSAAMSEPPAFNLTPLDHQLLAMTDEEFIAHSWDDLRDIIGQSITVLPDDSMLPLIEALSSAPNQVHYFPVPLTKLTQTPQRGTISAPSSANLPIYADIWPGQPKPKPNMAP